MMFIHPIVGTHFVFGFKKNWKVVFGASRNDVRRIHISNWESVWRRDELLNLSWFLGKGMSMYIYVIYGL